MAEPNISARLTEIWETPKSLYGHLTTVDHKIIGVRYIVTAIVFLVIGGVEALLMRLQLAGPEHRVLSPEAYDQIFSMHGITMMFWYAQPILSGFGNYLVPLMIGSRDMAYPRVNAFSYWVFLFSGVFLYGSWFLGQAPHAGWFAYTPYTLREFSPGLHMDFYALSLIFLSIATTAGAINFVVTIARLRAPGMSVDRMPLFLYSTFTANALVLFAMPALTVACLFLELDRRFHTHFFDVAKGGSSLLWQHTFWFFGHPWVYIVFLPATGMISMLLPTFARRTIVGYKFVAIATVMTGVVGFFVWVHHMFAVGMSHTFMSLFAAASMVISVFSTIQVLAWIATLYRGKPVPTTSLLFALGFLCVFVIGGLTGVITALIPFDWQLTDTYFVVAHLHYVMVGANLLPVMAGLYYWLPKISGRLMDERAGRVSFALVFLGFMVAFFPMHFTGLSGMPRRIYTFPAWTGWSSLNLTISVGAFILALGLLVSLVNFIVCIRRGKLAGSNPWQAESLEWSTASPPPAYALERLPTVTGRHPLWDAHDEFEDHSAAHRLDWDRLTLATSAWSARPLAISQMPEDTLAPLALALVLLLLFIALLAGAWVAGGVLAGLALLTIAVWNWPEKKAAASR
jgi:cytochrome c oxidase subunit I